MAPKYCKCILARSFVFYLNKNHFHIFYKVFLFQKCPQNLTSSQYAASITCCIKNFLENCKSFLTKILCICFLNFDANLQLFGIKIKIITKCYNSYTDKENLLYHLRLNTLYSILFFHVTFYFWKNLYIFAKTLFLLKMREEFCFRIYIYNRVIRGFFIIKTYSKNFINNFVIYRNYNIKIIDDYNFIRS